MKTLVYQYHTGPLAPWVEISRRSIEAFAAKIGAAYRMFTEPVAAEPASVYWGTFAPLLNGGFRDYDRLLYIDTDVLATPEAQDPFALGFERMAMTHLLDGPVREEKVRGVTDHAEAMEAGGALPHGHASAGVVLWPEGTAVPFAEWLRRNLPKLGRWASQKYSVLGNHMPWGGWDQAVLNVYGLNEKPLERLPAAFNYHLNQFEHDERRSASLIHYHGEHKALLFADAPIFGVTERDSSSTY